MNLKTKSRRQLILFIILAFAVVAIPVGLTIFNYRFAEQNPGGNDFLARWNGAHEWLMNGKNPYSDEVSLVAQKLIYGRAANLAQGEDIAHFVYPLYSMIFFAPFGMMEYTLARAVFMTVLELTLVLITIVSLRMTGWKIRRFRLIGVLLFGLLWYCGIRAVILGQFSAINALLMLLGIWAIQKNQDVAAGILLTLSTSKPQMSYLLIIYVLFWALSVKRWRLIGAMAASFAFVMVGSYLLLPGWPLDWLGQILNYPTYTDRIGSTLSIIASWVPGIMTQVNFMLHAAFYLYLVFEWIRSRGKGGNTFMWMAFLTLVVTNLVAYRTATPHYVALIAPLFLVNKITEERWPRIGKWINGLIYLFLFAGYWAIFLATVRGTDEQPVMYLVVPFFLLVLMWWIRWWLVRPMRSLLEDEPG
jgi:hypothetical protein